MGNCTSVKNSDRKFNNNKQQQIEYRLRNDSLLEKIQNLELKENIKRDKYFPQLQNLEQSTIMLSRRKNLNKEIQNMKQCQNIEILYDQPNQSSPKNYLGYKKVDLNSGKLLNSKSTNKSSAGSDSTLSSSKMPSLKNTQNNQTKYIDDLYNKNKNTFFSQTNLD
ncbi:hypothetical protein PPERSA_12915 [Pseudocohnilembus persalinus]|uniref:Uncharacterized protein n=1 Tax=Pseudocohnilembus persalinus TaxID=266149 RepID=A0A0V0R1N9_PSEPJ|nr:hypothetical protein PPERSA_12915 [Pseudocohnilembus persalinus]|eukprot:KRX08434.1 hypothetical protein PPERSA_12915 [Pseudocohnilembus persalinus]